jgi:hypothetical protein
MHNLNIDPRNRSNRSHWRRGFLLIPLALAWFALALASLAQLPSPAPDGGYPNRNTAEGDFALYSLTTGISNTALGLAALTKNTTGGNNTASGDSALFANIDGSDNTAVGVAALETNTSGDYNTAVGVGALEDNKAGNNNTASGYQVAFIKSSRDRKHGHGFSSPPEQHHGRR